MRSLYQFIVYFLSFADWLINISDASLSTNPSRKTIFQVEYKIFWEVQNSCNSFLSRTQRIRPIILPGLEARRKQASFNDFYSTFKKFGSLTCARELFKIFYFPPKKLRQFSLLILQVTSVQMWWVFPPKNLEKIQAPKIRMRRFFFFNFLTQSLYYCFK